MTTNLYKSINVGKYDSILDNIKLPEVATENDGKR